MSFTLQIDASAPDFDLLGTDGKRHSLAAFQDAKFLLVVFWCNHCPYVIGSEAKLIRLSEEYGKNGVKVVAINANSVENHPEDSFDGMVDRAKSQNYPFAYLRDETQETANAYGAMRTPHFYLFDESRKLRYTGRMDDNPKFPNLATTHELRDALDSLLAGREPTPAVTNPIGCNVKWQGQPEKWMPPEACDLIYPDQPPPPNPRS